MFFLIQRPARPDAIYWTGRRLLAVLDALVWPVVLAGAVGFAPVATQAVGALTVTLCCLVAFVRLRRAVFSNERYRFTTWRWGKLLAALMAIGILMKPGIWAAVR